MEREAEAKRAEEQKEVREGIRENGEVTLDHRIHLLSVIGEIEGHECLPNNSKTTKYEHVLPRLAAIEDSSEIDGVLVLLNTVGGDVEAGLAIAEMIASLSKPTVSLVLGGSHSIGVPIAVSTDYSFIVHTGTMVIHPVRMTGRSSEHRRPMITLSRCRTGFSVSLQGTPGHPGSGLRN